MAQAVDPLARSSILIFFSVSGLVPCGGAWVLSSSLANYRAVGGAGPWSRFIFIFTRARCPSPFVSNVNVANDNFDLNYSEMSLAVNREHMQHLA